MTTAWERIDEDYRTYLEKSGCSADDFNHPSFNRALAFNAFNAFNQQQRQPATCLLRVGRSKGCFEITKGARGNISTRPWRSIMDFCPNQQAKQVSYEGDDLVVKAYFRAEGDAMSFQTSLNEWELHKTLILLDGVEIDPPDPVAVHPPHDLSRFYIQHYQPNESESPCETLNQLESYSLSVPITEAVEPSDPVAIYQSLDVCVGRKQTL